MARKVRQPIWILARGSGNVLRTNSPDFPRLVAWCFRIVPGRSMANRCERSAQMPLKDKVFAIGRGSKKVAARLWGKPGRARSGLGRGGVGM